MNKMYLVLGDWSNDGHGKSDKVLLESDRTVKEVQEAYKASCKLTGVSFNHNDDYTGLDRDYEDSKHYRIAVDYDSPVIPAKSLEILKKFGFTFYDLGISEVDIEDFLIDSLQENGDLLIENDDIFVKLWIWFVKLSLPKGAILKEIEETTPLINGFWDTDLNVQFGYGLYC